ncbi:MAG: Carboxylesterase NlhH [Alphaproteobacteria bacterium MarineAlpha4_Bin2]|nr:MAG: Carboxylesterase NlhH [Alphaproteobacteria bacterium MarineAlpha4_Bin2]
MNGELIVNGKTLHPDMKALLEAREAAGPSKTIEEQRQAWTAYSQALSQPHPADMQTEDVFLLLEHGSVPVRVYRPAKADNPAPCIIYSHGGGFMKGDLDSSDTFAWGMAQDTNAVVVSVDYRLAPEHPFPAAFEDVYGTVCHVAESAVTFGIDPKRIAVCGDSAGGNLSAAACLAARDQNGPEIIGQSLIYPGTGLEQSGGSYEENAHAPGLTKAATEIYRDLYIPAAENENPYARPVLAGDFVNLPPAYIHTAQHDPIRDDGEIYADRLRAAGIDVDYHCAKNMMHGFLRARLVGPGGAAEYEKIVDWLRKRLQ